METTLKQLIKEAILEALVEFTNGGVATLSENDPGPENSNGSESGGTTGNGGNNSGQGGGSANNSGGTPSGDGRPKPDVGVGVWSRR